MKKIVIFSMVLFAGSKHLYSQMADEWINQKATQKKYLLQQIVALQTYIGYAKKGYAIVEKGVSTIRNIKNGDFNLQMDLFNSFKAINTKISNYVPMVNQ
jgi:hypothetical protein